MNQADKQRIFDLCAEHKAIDSKFIDTESVIVGYWPRFKCQYGCGAYGKNLCCPPYAPSPDETKKILSDFKVGLLVHFGGKIRVTKAIATIEREVFLLNYHKAMSFGAGPCRMCKECGLSECKVPKYARPSMEACGIDVYATAHNNNFPIQVLTSKEQELNCYALLLIE